MLIVSGQGAGLAGTNVNSEINVPIWVDYIYTYIFMEEYFKGPGEQVFVFCFVNAKSDLDLT